MLTSLYLSFLLPVLPAGAPQTPPGTPPASASPSQVVERVVVTASVAPVPSESVSRAVTVLSREDLEQLGITSVVDALRLVPGLDARARGPHDVQTDFSIHGATFGQSLVLVDGLRLNDTQSGHHNGDLPAAVSGLDRVEVVEGGSSAVHGADALGGVVNLISRTGRYAAAGIEGGEHHTVSAQGSASGVGLPKAWMVTGWGSGSRGFTFDRGYAIGGVMARGALAPGWLVDVRHQRKWFGANGFYGASPSKEWTDQTVGALTFHHVVGPWITEVRGLVRDHGDHFRWDIARPGFAENRHRTNAAEFTATAERDFSGGRRLTAGTTAGGDWITSSNLGDHRYGRGSGFAELQVPLAARTLLQAGVRLDGYSNFGHSWNPSVGVSTWVAPAVRLRASVARAFRIPTFTELYYHDPANQGSATLTSERGWSFDGGADLVQHGWTFSVSPFRRRDQNVIDWVKALPTDLWVSTNVRDVTTTGLEGSLARTWHSALFRLSFTGLKVDAPTLTLLSKYVNEYARHSTTGSIAVPIGAGVRVAVTVDHRHRFVGQAVESYSLVSARIARGFRHAEVYVDGTNLSSATYHEIAGVSMPGRWVMVGIALR